MGDEALPFGLSRAQKGSIGQLSERKLALVQRAGNSKSAFDREREARVEKERREAERAAAEYRALAAEHQGGVSAAAALFADADDDEEAAAQPRKKRRNIDLLLGDLDELQASVQAQHEASNNLFFGDLPHHIAEHNLFDMFLPFGAIASLKIFDNEGGRRPHAFVAFMEPRSATLAVESLTGRSFHGEHLRINAAPAIQVRGPMARAPFWPPPGPLDPEWLQLINERGRQPAESAPGGADAPGERRRRGRSLQRDAYEAFLDILDEVTLERASIRRAMGFAFDHSDCAEDIVEIVTRAILDRPPLLRQIALLFVVSDLLYNSQAPVRNASMFRTELQARIPEVFEVLTESARSLTGRVSATAFRRHVMRVVNAWMAWSIFPMPLLRRLSDTFGGAAPGPPEQEQEQAQEQAQDLTCTSQVDTQQFGNEGAEGAAHTFVDEHIDGEPMDEGEWLKMVRETGMMMMDVGE